MMNEKMTDYGRRVTGSRDELFARALELSAAARTGVAGGVSLALTGGSTPQEWYRWCAACKRMPGGSGRVVHFTVSDERCVPLHSEQSNFGNACRLVLDPLGLPSAQRHPWPVELLPEEAAAAYDQRWKTVAGPDRAYDVCFLGMGDDGHTASLFPGSQLLRNDGGRLFSAVDVPGKGWRLTVTPTGLGTCGLIVIMALGASKNKMLKRVFTGAFDPLQTPVQLVKHWRDRVVWLLDHPAADGV